MEVRDEIEGINEGAAGMSSYWSLKGGENWGGGRENRGRMITGIKTNIPKDNDEYQITWEYLRPQFFFNNMIILIIIAIKLLIFLVFFCFCFCLFYFI